MTQNNLITCGRLIAACESYNPDMTAEIAAKAIRNPQQLLPYWFADTMRKAATGGDDVAGKMLADLGGAMGEIEAVTPAQSGVIHVAYIKAGMEPQIADARKDYGLRVRAARERAGLTIQALADISGLRKQNLSRIESGRYNVTLDVMTRIRIALGAEI